MVSRKLLGLGLESKIVMMLVKKLFNAVPVFAICCGNRYIIVMFTLIIKRNAPPQINKAPKICLIFGRRIENTSFKFHFITIAGTTAIASKINSVTTRPGMPSAF